VLEAPSDGDLGAIFGWGFAPFTGGPFSLADSWGATELAERLTRLADQHGERFAPPRLLTDTGEKSRSFYPAG
jgi:3-hydroxyacyl-CoA dehydrogenase/enoyl-CoA hydratase/3-hydroxybutyryl-CoA epimerase